MKPSELLNRYRNEVRAIALRHHVSGIRVFGSVLRGNDTDSSDLDLLVEPTRETTLLDIGAIRYELRELMGIDVDVITPKALPPNFREQILAEAQPV